MGSVPLRRREPPEETRNQTFREVYQMAKGVQVIVSSRIKEVAKGGKVRVSGEFYEAANKAAVDLLQKAIGRCKANGRSTLRPQDL